MLHLEGSNLLELIAFCYFKVLNSGSLLGRTKVGKLKLDNIDLGQYIFVSVYVGALSTSLFMCLCVCACVCMRENITSPVPCAFSNESWTAF